MHKKENNVVGNIRKFIRLDITWWQMFWWQIGGIRKYILDEFYFRWFENDIIEIGEAEHQRSWCLVSYFDNANFQPFKIKLTFDRNARSLKCCLVFRVGLVITKCAHSKAFNIWYRLKDTIVILKFCSNPVFFN